MILVRNLLFIQSQPFNLWNSVPLAPLRSFWHRTTLTCVSAFLIGVEDWWIFAVFFSEVSCVFYVFELSGARGIGSFTFRGFFFSSVWRICISRVQKITGIWPPMCGSYGSKIHYFIRGGKWDWFLLLITTSYVPLPISFLDQIVGQVCDWSWFAEWVLARDVICMVAYRNILRFLLVDVMGVARPFHIKDLFFFPHWLSCISVEDLFPGPVDGLVTHYYIRLRTPTTLSAQLGQFVGLFCT